MRNTLNFWGISLVTTTVAVAVAVNLESSARGSKDGVLPIKSADFLRLTENEVKFTNWESMAERKKSCAPTILCTRAGGYCVRSRADCTGVVDPHGCRRGRSCKCCIPDQTSPAPPACPSVDCTPCPTSDITTGGPTTYIPTEGPTTAITPKGPTTARNTEGPTTAETTESQNTTRTTDGPTTARITKGPITTKTTEGPTTARITEGPTAAITTEDDPTESNLPWVTVNSDQFVRLDQQASWDDARTLCRRQGLDLFEHPRDVVALSKYLDENFSKGHMWHWLGARGNGTNMVWVSGDIVTRDAMWYSSYYNNVGINDCLLLNTHHNWYQSHDGLVLETHNCARADFNFICG